MALDAQRLKERYARIRDLIDMARLNASTDWEESFVADMAARFNVNGALARYSDREMEKLEEIARGDD